MKREIIDLLLVFHLIVIIGSAYLFIDAIKRESITDTDAQKICSFIALIFSLLALQGYK